MTPLTLSAKAPMQNTLAMNSLSAMMLGPVVTWYARLGYGGTSLNRGRIGGFACAVEGCGIESLDGFCGVCTACGGFYVML